MTNWKTTFAGIVAIIVGIVQCFHQGTIDLNCIYKIILGGGLMLAKDYDVTGGTRKAGGQ
jgi:hypothetical protein